MFGGSFGGGCPYGKGGGKGKGKNGKGKGKERKVRRTEQMSKRKQPDRRGMQTHRWETLTHSNREQVGGIISH